jgi:chromosomal replication initiation ATPase DnaA
MNLYQQIQHTRSQVTRAMDSLNTLGRRLEVELGRQGAIHPAVAVIQQTVCDHYQLPTSAMRSGLRPRAIAQPRGVAMALCCELTNLTSFEIGRCFYKDHSTVLHAQKRVKDRLATEKGVPAVYELLKTTATTRLHNREMPLFAAFKAV